MIALIAGPEKPPRKAQGLGLPYLAASLEASGFEVRIFDLYPASAETDDPAGLDALLADTVAAAKPELVGITIHTPEYAARVRLAGLLRERMPGTLLVAGGHHPSAAPERLLDASAFDLCVVGEGEANLVEIARRVKAGAAAGTDDWLSDIPGVVYRHNGHILHTEPSRPLADLDSVPFPAHHLLGLEEYGTYNPLGIKTTSIVSYRGCPMRCSFCLNPLGNRVRRRRPQNVVAEMTRVVQDFRVRSFSFHDNLFGLSRDHTLALCDEIIEHRPDVFWDCWTAGDLIDAESAARMKAAGCTGAGFGAESGDDGVLLKSRRGFTAAQNQAGIDALRGAGLRVGAFFMLGLPGETEASVSNTIEFAADSGADSITLGVFRPYPGTAIWNDPEAFNVRLTEGDDFEAFVETEHLSRTRILELTKQAINNLQHKGFVKVDALRFDRYEWE